jgi:hypothetical protein
LDDTVDGCDAVVGEYSEVGVEPMFVDCAQHEVGNVYEECREFEAFEIVCM